jgi:acetyl esterase/lipase
MPNPNDKVGFDRRGATMRMAMDPLDKTRIETVIMNGVSTRYYRWHGAERNEHLPVIFFMHGGGFVFGSAKVRTTR